MQRLNDEGVPLVVPDMNQKSATMANEEVLASELIPDALFVPRL